MFYSVDRFEGETAILVDDAGIQQDVPAGQLPAGSREGDILRFEEDAYCFDEAETNHRKRRIQGLLEELLGGGKK